MVTEDAKMGAILHLGIIRKICVYHFKVVLYSFITIHFEVKRRGPVAMTEPLWFNYEELLSQDR